MVGLLMEGAALACSATPGMMAGMAGAAQNSYAAMDDDAFYTARRLMLTAASCLTAAPSPIEAAEVYRIEALAAFIERDEPSTVAWLRAMLEADPAALIPAEVAPPGHTLQLLLDTAQRAQASPRVVARVHGPCALLVDGVLAREVPLERPSLVVVQTPDGKTMWSGLVPANPAVIAICEQMPDDSATAAASRRRPRP